MKKLFASFACIAALAACTKTVPVYTNEYMAAYPDGRAYELRITPVITKVTDTDFQDGDAIGVSVSRESGAYLTNEKLVFGGGEFSGEAKWYREGADVATVKAYYPYSASASGTFTVQADQSGGTSSSDFVAGIATGVNPSASAITIPFKHKLASIAINVDNQAGGEIESIVLKGGKLVAKIADDFTTSVEESAPVADITAYKKSANSYVLILPPQTVTFVASVTTGGGNTLTQGLAEVTLEYGKRYKINMVVNPDNLKVVLSGQVENWEDGGNIPPQNVTPPAPIQFEEKLSDGYFTYDNVKYNVTQLKDGKWWMAQNLAYVPQGIVVCADINNVTGGVYYPLVMDSQQIGFSLNASTVASKGYLYQAEVALGLNVGDIKTVAQAEALEGAQGICPPGWHLPTMDDIMGLVGKCIGQSNDDTAPYYEKPFTKLNQDGFNLEAYGSVSITSATASNGTFMGALNGYPDKISSGMMTGSSYGGVTYITSGDASSGIKNLQFYGFTAMTNKASEDDFTFSGAKVAFRLAGAVRCVRNSN